MLQQLIPPQKQHVENFTDSLQSLFGLDLGFRQENTTTISGQFTAPEDWKSWVTILHGGFQGLLLNEAISAAAKTLLNVPVFAPREMTFRYRRPVYVGQQLGIFGHLVEDQGRSSLMRGEIKDTSGKVLTDVRSVLDRLNPDDVIPMIGEKLNDSDAQIDLYAVKDWPAWPLCCPDILERLWDMRVNWRVSPDCSAMAGFLILPDILRDSSMAGVIAALCDQGLGLLGHAQGHGMLLTLRLQLTLYHPAPVGEELILLSQGFRWLDGPFKAQAWLKCRGTLLARASGHFVVHNVS